MHTIANHQMQHRPLLTEICHGLAKSRCCWRQSLICHLFPRITESHNHCFMCSFFCFSWQISCILRRGSWQIIEYLVISEQETPAKCVFLCSCCYYSCWIDDSNIIFYHVVVSECPSECFWFVSDITELPLNPIDADNKDTRKNRIVRWWDGQLFNSIQFSSILFEFGQWYWYKNKLNLINN